MRSAVQLALTGVLVLAPAADAQGGDRSLDLERSYREALAELAAGAVGTAVGRVVALETETSEECVRAIELATARRLAQREPEAPVTQAALRLAVLRARVAARPVAGHLYNLERVSIFTLRRLADTYLGASRREEAPSVAAGLWTLLAHDLAEPHSVERLDAARELLRAAVELDPEHPAALHSLAVTFELLDLPGRALPVLDRLIALAPDAPEFRLRRAVVTVKAGRLERGLRLLEELAAAGPPWVRDLAIQERARLLAMGGRREEAEALLRAALGEAPREKLSLQLAALLDPRWDDSWEVLAAWLAAPHRDAGPSARFLYDEGAKREIEALRREIDAGVTARAADLVEALRGLPDRSESDWMVRANCR